jgi:hypothetical protein
LKLRGFTLTNDQVAVVVAEVLKTKPTSRRPAAVDDAGGRDDGSDVDDKEIFEAALRGPRLRCRGAVR